MMGKKDSIKYYRQYPLIVEQMHCVIIVAEAALVSRTAELKLYKKYFNQLFDKGNIFFFFFVYQLLF